MGKNGRKIFRAGIRAPGGTAGVHRSGLRYTPREGGVCFGWLGVIIIGENREGGRIGCGGYCGSVSVVLAYFCVSFDWVIWTEMMCHVRDPSLGQKKCVRKCAGRCSQR